nr:ABC transporter substrate-binding protein [uncultured Rhodopila sp.]
MRSLYRRGVLLGGTATALAPAIVRHARADQAPGVTDAEIKFGNTMPYSGPISANATIGRVEAAYFRMINEQGGINGRKLNFISCDDAGSPPKTVEQTRRLVEEDGVAFLFHPLGSSNAAATYKYLNGKKIPHLFIPSGADKWGVAAQLPWTIGWMPSFRVEAGIYARHVKSTKPAGKIGILYQNDDPGKDYVAGVRDGRPIRPRTDSSSRATATVSESPAA